MSAATATTPVILVRKSDRGPMASGGTGTYEVHLDGRWVGWVGDERGFSGSRFGARRWWACHRQDGDLAARWSSSGYRTRQAAVEALTAVAS
ncbi:hypothetical protein ACFPK1_18870 [Actinomycetospora rhizophila]|uniref:DUF1508 domain-containing protein n=1 Tax=Actinomycetospora rhizophila TaxID=1416876 RepID=A0ABV9ZJ36_9PSEU